MKILNSAGVPIELTAHEKFHAAWVQKQMKERFANDLGAEIDITSLSAIQKKVIEQKFFEVAPADHVPVRVGESPWSSNLVTYREFSGSDGFETGLVNSATDDGKLAGVQAGVDSVSVPVKNWAKQTGWNIMELAQASRAGNWDLVTSRERARKRNWDLGIQKVAFLGLKGSTQVKGLLNQVGVTLDTTTITAPISTMTTAQLKAFTAAIYESYRANSFRTCKPTHFSVPESDYNGMCSTVSPDFPIKSVLTLLLESFQDITGNKNFKIQPIAYADPIYSDGNFSKSRYALYNYDEDSIRMDIPVDYTATMANSINNFTLQNVAYGQFTGVFAYRPAEIIYYQIGA